MDLVYSVIITSFLKYKRSLFLLMLMDLYMNIVDSLWICYRAFWGLVLLLTMFGGILNDYYFILCSLLLILSLLSLDPYLAPRVFVIDHHASFLVWRLV